MARPTKKQDLLTFGHRLGMLRDLWGFPISKELVDYLGGGSRKKDPDYKLDVTTVSRWIRPSGGAARDISLEILQNGLARYCVDKGYPDSNGRADEAREDLEAALQGSDTGFTDYVAKRPTLLPIPKSISDVTVEQQDGLQEVGVGLYLLYRLGKTPSKKKGGNWQLLCVPVKLDCGPAGFVRWSELFFDLSSSGYVFALGPNATILGDDPNPVSRTADLFFGQLEKFTGRGVCRGILTMIGDDESLSAYSIALERVGGGPGTADDDQESTWRAFAEEHGMRMPLEQGRDGTFGFVQTKGGNTPAKSPAGTKYSKILEIVSRHPTDALR